MATVNLSLTAEQRAALLAADDHGVVTVVDPATNRSYVLIQAELFERYKALFSEDEMRIADAYPAMDEVARREGWLDAEMDAYDRLDPRRPS